MTSQAPPLPRFRETATLEAVLELEENMIIKLNYPELRRNFFMWLKDHHEDIEEIVSYHLGLTGSESCRIGEMKEWMQGGFNVCIPVHVDNWIKHPGKRVLIRFPLPYKIGEFPHPGNADEKLRCEAATYIWIRDHCPDVPIPYLWGFGFSGGQSFTQPGSSPLHTRLIWYLRRHISSLFGSTLPCRYISHRRPCLWEYGYLVMDYIEDTDAKMLAETWDESRHSQDHRTNLFRDLSRIMLSLSQVPLPRIGSWTLDADGVVQLANRPLTLPLHQAENELIPTNIERSSTYSATDGYYLDLLSCHDNRIRHQVNSMKDEVDGRVQMANLMIMRGLLSQFTDPKFRHGPFCLRLTDLHQGNIFVDDNWHIKYVVDLEWACSVPVETLRPPHWLTGYRADNMTGQRLDDFTKMHHEFMGIFEEEEKSFPPIDGVASYRTDIMRKGLEIGRFWYFQALDSPKGLYNIFRHHIQPIYAPHDKVCLEFPRIVSQYWTADVKKVIRQKLQDKRVYEDMLRQGFGIPSDSSGRYVTEQSWNFRNIRRR
ncbi:hypothetical protein B7494_g6423 [Chlorociboria aeruginascens]|nr:hypothetical protein B7494_g6423 [Chlorociboria aeruginascens]